eukprot:346377-Pelagomonas_calceolata.AAC.3
MVMVGQLGLLHSSHRTFVIVIEVAQPAQDHATLVECSHNLNASHVMTRGRPQPQPSTVTSGR